MKKITFKELSKMHNKSIDSIYAYEDEAELGIYKGRIEINGASVFNIFSNKVTCTNDSFACIHFYNRQKQEVANLFIFNVENECLIIRYSYSIYGQTSLRVLNSYEPDRI
jgi:hypothetical protein